MNGADLIKWIKKNKAEDMKIMALDKHECDYYEVFEELDDVCIKDGCIYIHG